MGKMSGSHCLVMGCRNRQLLNQTNTRSYFRFPRDPEMCKQWVEFCNRPELWKKYDENGPEYLYKSSRICSDHFQPNDFNNPNLFSQGLKKGSVPTLYPASKEPKTRISIGGGFGGGNSPPNGHHNQQQQQPDHDSLILSMSTKRPLPAHQQQSQQPVAKRRSLPPAATSAATLATHAAVSGALAGLIQRQQLKEQQRKAFAAALQLQAQHQQQQQQQNQQPRSLLASVKQKTANNNNNNNIISNLNGKAAAAAAQEKLEDERGYGINYVDMDGGDSSEYDSSYQAEDELVAYKQLQQMKAVKAAAAVIPASLKSELTVTAAVNHHNNNNNNNNSKDKDGLSPSNGTVNYKEKYEQTLKELFACRKIVKNQNNAIQQLQGEIDFLNQLLKEK
ncbi:nuclear transcription factor Y subunit beta-like isoform X1 [Culex pipiens pallens]|uniref:nuclear transcription factor Y subunit beta-like isoform X1 n=1 Tax=Culex pipiens pallens TaxID=42434 RepID=UPI0019532893|nr:nuclear transcription factor Y subunit beta-like isoform X1 [Culex pipiens pallens]